MEISTYSSRPIVKIYLFVLGFFNALLYTPIVFSLVFIFLAGLVLIQGNGNSEILRLIPNGSYSGNDVMKYYGIVSLVISAVISLLEIVARKKFVISAKAKILGLGIFFTVGYLILYILFVNRTDLNAGAIIGIILSLYLITISAIIANALLTKFIKWVNKAF